VSYFKCKQNDLHETSCAFHAIHTSHYQHSSNNRSAGTVKTTGYLIFWDSEYIYSRKLQNCTHTNFAMCVSLSMCNTTKTTQHIFMNSDDQVLTKSSKHSNFSQNQTTVMNILHTMYVCFCDYLRYLLLNIYQRKKCFEQED